MSAAPAADSRPLPPSPRTERSARHRQADRQTFGRELPIEGARPWSDGLPRRRREELAVERLRASLEGRLGHWVETYREPLTKTLADAWLGRRPQRPTSRWTVAGPDGGDREVTLSADPLRLGGGADCHLRLAGAAAEEALEVRWTGDDAEKIFPQGNPEPLAAGDTFEIGGHRLTYLGLEPADTAGESLAIAVGEAQVLTTDRPQDQLGGAGDPWFRLRCGDWRGWCRLPVGWLSWAHRRAGLTAIDGADDPLVEVDRGVDRAVTAYLLEDTARRLAGRLGQPLEVSHLVPSEVLELPPGGPWFALRLEVAVEGTGPDAWDLTLLWRDDEPEDGAGPDLDGLAFEVAVVGSWLRLRLGELAELKVGDVLLPEVFGDPEGDPDPEGEPREVVLLRLQDRWREARRRDGRLVLSARPWQESAQGGDPMMPETEATLDDAPEADAAAFDPQDLEVVLAFEVGRLAVPLRELQSWREGSVVEIARQADAPVDIWLRQGNGARRLGRGRALVVDGRLGVRIDQWSAPPEEAS